MITPRQSAMGATDMTSEHTITLTKRTPIYYTHGFFTGEWMLAFTGEEGETFDLIVTGERDRGASIRIAHLGVDYLIKRADLLTVKE